MQDYTDFAKKNKVTLLESGSCQFCGAQTKRGIHECLEISNLGFDVLNFANPQNHLHRFLIVDAHALQHPEIHGRWSNHFHLTRLHLIFKYHIQWTYQWSPKLSDFLNAYKAKRPDEHLQIPQVLRRGNLTIVDVKSGASNRDQCISLIEKWAMEVYTTWGKNHTLIDEIAKGFTKAV